MNKILEKIKNKREDKRIFEDDIIKINQLFQKTKIKAKIKSIEEGLRVCRYYIELEIGEKVSKIRNLSEEISLIIHSLTPPSISLDTKSGYLMIEATISDRPININLNQIKDSVDLDQYQIPLIIGNDMSNNTIAIDLVECPHLMIGGSTGSGKSVLTRTLIKSIQMKYNPKQLRTVLIDPKGTELSEFKDKYCQYYTSNQSDTITCLHQAADFMDSRYQMMSKKNVQKIQQLPRNKFPYIVIIIDELADVLLQDIRQAAFKSLVRLLQKARAAGIHIIVNTQRPSRDIIKGLIKANIPTQIALKTSSNYDSRIIIGTDGAENLVGKGDLLLNYQGKITRIQGAQS